MIDLFEKGLPPVSGGTLQQAAWFVNASRFAQHEKNRIVEKLNP